MSRSYSVFFKEIIKILKVLVRLQQVLPLSYNELNLFLPFWRRGHEDDLAPHKQHFKMATIGVQMTISCAWKLIVRVLWLCWLSLGQILTSYRCVFAGERSKIALLKWVDVRNAITYVNCLMNVIAFTSIPSHTRECGYTLTRNYHKYIPALVSFCTRSCTIFTRTVLAISPPIPALNILVP